MKFHPQGCFFICAADQATVWETVAPRDEVRLPLAAQNVKENVPYGRFSRFVNRSDVLAIHNAKNKYNNAIEQIMLQLGINKHITTHSARVRMANIGTIAQAQARLGLTNVKTLQTHYREASTDAE